MKRRPWTEAELGVLRRYYQDAPTAELARLFRRPIHSVYDKAQKLGLHKSDAFLASHHAGRLLRGVRRSPDTEFKPGMVPWNKGTHYVAGGRSAETRFKPGQGSKRWDPEVYAVGALRINTYGGLDIKVREGARAWVSMARWVWEQAHGQIPRDKVVRARNGDPHDTRLGNLYLATRAEMMAQNTIHNLPKPLAQAIQLRAALNRKINRRRQREQDDQRPA